MLKIRFSIVRIIMAVFASSLLFLCAPLPIIQSARVSGGPGINVTYTTPTVHLDILVKGVCTDCTTRVEWREDKYPEQDEPRILFRMGILNRVEVMARVLPYYLAPGILVGGNVKLALFDVGTERLFRNIQSALFCGGDYLPVEHTPSTAYWGGVIIGTHSPVGSNDLELVTAISGSNYLQSIDYLMMSNLTYKTMNLSFGCIFKPFTRHFMEINAGISGRIPLEKDASYSYLHCYIPDHDCVAKLEIEEFNIYPLVLQCGIAFYLPDKR